MKENSILEEKKEEAKWYAIRAHSGFEDSVIESINLLKESMDLGDEIQEIFFPKQVKVIMRNGKRIEKEERLYPGFILIKMIMSDNIKHALSNVERTSGFIGSRTTPSVLSEEEIATIKDRIKNHETKEDIGINIGDKVIVTEGPFSDLEGVVEEIDASKGQVVVLIHMFGKQTPVKLETFQVKGI